MEELTASRTAMATSLMRAVHTRTDPAPLFRDPWGDRIVPAQAMAALQKIAGIAAGNRSGAKVADESRELVDDMLRRNPAYTNVIVRTRYTEDALAEAVAAGITQYVLIGAGFDSYALRIPLEARHLKIYEVDHPSTQSVKIHQLAALGVSGHDGLDFVAADLGVESLESALSRSSYDFSQPAFFSWLGVTMYLTRAANMGTLGSVAHCGAPGSQLVFSYIDQALFESVPATSREQFSNLEQSVKAVGEPFISGFEPLQLAREIRALGLELEEDITDVTLVERYDTAGSNQFYPSEHSRIARVRVQNSRN